MHPALTDLIDHLGPTPALVTADELRACVLLDNADVLVLNKPGWLVCHPSKNGPMSSLVGAVREVFGLDQVHLVSRLDRETSGLVLLAKHKAAARHLQMALQAGYVEKRYCAILHGALDQSRVEVSQALEPDPESPVAAQVRVAPRGGGQKAQSTFKRLDVRGDYTLAEVRLHTGRKHQIRAHAAWLGHPVVGDKIYGGDPTCFLDFIEKGWTTALAQRLAHPRQLLHAAKMVFPAPDPSEPDWVFAAPLPGDWEAFWENA